MSRATRLKATGPFRDGFELPDLQVREGYCGGAPQAGPSGRKGMMMQVPVELDPDVEDEAPTGDDITPYDEQHYVTYLRLLDAKAEGADWTEVAQIVLHRDPVAEKERTYRCWQSHLERAQWLSREGYRKILEKAVAEGR